MGGAKSVRVTWRKCRSGVAGFATAAATLMGGSRSAAGVCVCQVTAKVVVCSLIILLYKGICKYIF